MAFSRCLTASRAFGFTCIARAASLEAGGSLSTVAFRFLGGMLLLLLLLATGLVSYCKTNHSKQASFVSALKTAFVVSALP
jgi:hypothetical protein